MKSKITKISVTSTRMPNFNTQRILGIDPGLATTGFGVIDCERGVERWVKHGVILTEKGLSLPERLHLLRGEIAQLCRLFRPTRASVEKLFFARNVKTAMHVAECRGIIMEELQSQGLPIDEYTPMQVKLALAGYGGASKQQIQFMAQSILKLTETPKPDDAADALAMALCASQHLSSFSHRL